jgi:hypothetical protein
MLRYAAIVVVAVALVALAARAPARRVLWAVGGAILLYAVLKLTGVVDALAPDRIGVF